MGTRCYFWRTGEWECQFWIIRGMGKEWIVSLNKKMGFLIGWMKNFLHRANFMKVSVWNYYIRYRIGALSRPYTQLLNSSKESWQVFRKFFIQPLVIYQRNERKRDCSFHDFCKPVPGAGGVTWAGETFGDAFALVGHGPGTRRVVGMNRNFLLEIDPRNIIDIRSVGFKSRNFHTTILNLKHNLSRNFHTTILNLKHNLNLCLSGLWLQGDPL